MTWRDKLILKPGARLSENFGNSRDHYKIVEDYILGYEILGASKVHAARLSPIYRAEIWHRTTKRVRGKLISAWVITSSYELGEPLNADYQADPVGNALASVINSAAIGLEERARLLKASKRKRRAP